MGGGRSLFMFVLVASIFSAVGTVPSDVRASFARPGDFVVAGLFPFHFSGSEPCDSALSGWAVELSQTMVFAVEAVNRRADILPNVTLGFELRDDCYSEATTLYAVLSLLGRNGKFAELDISEEESGSPGRQNGTLLGAIGPVSSANSIVAAMTAGLFQVPVISYLATSDELSDRHRFPYFLRSTPPDKLNARAVVDLLLRFGWDYVGMIYSLDSYGIRGAQEVQKLTEKAGICLAFSAPIGKDPSTDEVEEIVQKMKRHGSATVLIIFSATGAPYSVLDEFYRQVPGSNLTFIGSAAFETVDRLKKVQLSVNTLGGIFAPLLYQKIDGFQRYFQSVGESEQSVWYREFQTEWMVVNNCSDALQCSALPSNSDEVFVMNAVYVFAHALHQVLTSVCQGNLTCTTGIVSVGERFLPYLLRVDFQGADGPFRFESNGEPTGRYVLRNVVMTADGTIGTVQVGVWDSQKTDGRLRIEGGAVVWAGGTGTPPRSTCRQACRLGFIEVPLEKKCCWGCRRCPENAVITESGTECVPCEATHWPSPDRARCDPITPASISWASPPALTVLVLSGTGLVLSAAVSTAMYRSRRHPLIKATSRELSAVQIGGLFLAFATSIATLARPSKLSCHAAVTLTALCFTVMFSTILLKVNRIYRIFKAGKKSRKRPPWTSPRTQIGIVSFLILIQVVISIVSILLNLTAPALLVEIPASDYIELYCRFGLDAIASCAYNLLLILVCCFYAFKTRKVPCNYNESKFIAANVYSTLVFCLAALPVYLTASTAGQKAVTLGIVVLLNAYITVILSFLPKLYAVRFVEDTAVRGGTDTTGTATISAGSTSTGDRRVHPSQPTADGEQATSDQPQASATPNSK